MVGPVGSWHSMCARFRIPCSKTASLATCAGRSPAQAWTAQGISLRPTGGTAFLDEIGGLAATNQRKLLRAIETKVFRPVGGRADRRSDFRLVAATNDDLRRLAADGMFRDDLIDRLGAAVITVSALADRLDNVPALATHFLTIADPSRRFALSALAIRELSRYDWPGNVRELRNVISRVVALAYDSMISCDEVRSAMAYGRAAASAGRLLNDDELAERESLAATLRDVGWDTDVVARQLGVSRSTVYRRMVRLGIDAKAPEHPLKEARSGAREMRAVV